MDTLFRKRKDGRLSKDDSRMSQSSGELGLQSSGPYDRMRQRDQPPAMAGNHSNGGAHLGKVISPPNTNPALREQGEDLNFHSHRTSSSSVPDPRASRVTSGMSNISAPSIRHISGNGSHMETLADGQRMGLPTTPAPMGRRRDSETTSIRSVASNPRGPVNQGLGDFAPYPPLPRNASQQSQPGTLASRTSQSRSSSMANGNAQPNGAPLARQDTNYASSVFSNDSPSLAADGFDMPRPESPSEIERQFAQLLRDHEVNHSSSKLVPPTANRTSGSSFASSGTPRPDVNDLSLDKKWQLVQSARKAEWIKEQGRRKQVTAHERERTTANEPMDPAKEENTPEYHLKRFVQNTVNTKSMMTLTSQLRTEKAP